MCNNALIYLHHADSIKIHDLKLVTRIEESHQHVQANWFLQSREVSDEVVRMVLLIHSEQRPQYLSRTPLGRCRFRG